MSVSSLALAADIRRPTLPATPAPSPMSAVHFRADVDATGLGPRSPGNAEALSSYAVDTRSSLRQKVNAKLLILVGRAGFEPATKRL